MIPKRFKRKKRSSGVIFPIVFCSLVLLVISFLIVSNLKLSRKRRKLTSQVDYLKAEIQKAEEQKSQFSEEVSEGGTEEHLEEKLREELLLKKPGENVVGIIEEEGIEIELESEAETEPEKSFFDKILEFFRLK